MPSTFITRRGVLAVVAATVAFPHVRSQAQSAWPDRPIRLVIPFAAGGGTDIIGRPVAAKLAERLGQAVVVDNKGGAGGIMGYNAVAKAPADGYTLLLMTTAFCTNPSTGRKLSFDPVKDFMPIGLIASTPLLIVVAKDSPYTTLRELVEAARSKPNSVTYGSNGVGSMSHLAAEMLASETKTQMLHVAYKGIPPALTDVMAGRVTMAATSFASSSALTKAGRLRALAVTSTHRAAPMPDLPTTAEAGYPAYRIDFWYGLMAPTGVPLAIIKRVNAELNAVMAQPDMREILGREAGIPGSGSPEDFGKLVSNEFGRWGKLIKDANINFE